MWEKFRQSKFAKKCKDFSGRGGAVVAVVCLVVALAVILTVSIATNRAKRGEGEEDTTVSGAVQGTEKNPSGNSGNKPPKDEKETEQVGAEVTEFELAAPVDGVIAKGHDATIQVWSSTMEDYRVHLGVDITTVADAPVYAAADGVVSKVWDDVLMGKCVAISHDGDIITVYKNLNTNLTEGIKQGSEVKCGQQIGNVGETAIAELAEEPHLHLEMTVGGLSVDPVEYFSEQVIAALSKDTAFESSAVGEDMTETSG